MNTPLFDSHKREDCEAHLLQTIKAEIQKLWDRTVVYFEQSRQYLEIRRHPDTHEEMDYELRLRELEGNQQRGFRMGDYEGGKHSWKDWILGLVGIVIVAWLARISAQMDDLTKVIVRQESDEKQLDAIDRQIQRLDCTVYKVCP